MDKRKICVPGGGCRKCEPLLSAAKEAVQNREIDADIACITDFAVIAGYGILQTPALMIDGKVVSEGRVLRARTSRRCCKVQRNEQGGYHADRTH